MKIYLIPGLGFDRRIFKHLKLDPFDLHYLNWIDPLPEESLPAYASRLSDFIEEDSIVLGHSFGGILAQEIAQFKQLRQLILISSIRSNAELPLNFKTIGYLGLYRFFNRTTATLGLSYWGPYYDYESAEEQALFTDMVQANSNDYLQWSLRNLAFWKEAENKNELKVTQIHGQLDRIFPISRIQNPDVVLPKAGHFMIYKRAQVLSQIIQKSID